MKNTVSHILKCTAPVLLTLMLSAAALSCTKPLTDTGQKTKPVSGLEVPEIVWDGKKNADITYQALIYSFADSNGDRIGDLNGLKSRLDYLDRLGISAIWLSPVHPSSSYHGYDVLDYSSVNSAFGTENDLKDFIDAAHSHDIKVYLDYVLNHTSSSHPWFNEAKSSPDSPYRDFYIFSRTPQQDIASGLIPQIATEGASGYDSGQWFPSDIGAGTKGRMRFVLDWNMKTVTVTQTDAPADLDNTDNTADGIYIWYGNEVSERFHQTEDGIYELVTDFESDWGFLIRTSLTSWENGTKYGAPQNAGIIVLGEPFRLDNSQNCGNIRFTQPLMYHSHFWTGSFADLNYGPADNAEQSPAFKAMAEAADKWIRIGVDGFRLDAVKHIYHNAGSNENPVFLKKFYDRCNASYKENGGEGEFYMVGEMLDSGENAAPYYAGLPALFEFSFWYKLKWALQNNTGCYFAKDILELQPRYEQYRSGYIEATKLSNHDEDRTGSELGQSKDKMKLAAAVLLTSQGEPYIYQGEELGYWGKKNNGDEYVRTPMMWEKSGSTLATEGVSGKYDKNMLNAEMSVEAQLEDSGSVLRSYIYFSQLRHRYPALAKGKMRKHGTYNENNDKYKNIAAWYMELGSDRVLVVHNFGSSATETYFSDAISEHIALQGNAKLQKSGSMWKLTIGGYSSIVFRLI